jgi:hypothetical protein
MNILVAGGTGFIGRHLVRSLEQDGHRISLLSRRKSNTPNVYSWDPLKQIIDYQALQDQDVVVNLSGAGIAKKIWTKKYRREILQSRVLSNRVLADAILKTRAFPRYFINASAVGYYGQRQGISIDEKSPAGTGFLASTCVAWENELNLLFQSQVHCSILRLGIVLGPDGGSLPKLKRSLDLGLNIIFDQGHQYISWIHIDDIAGIVKALISHALPAGIYNAVSPNPVMQTELNSAILQTCRRKAINMRIPGKLLRLILGEMATLFTSDQHIVPQKLLAQKFKFEYPEIKRALLNVFAE